MSQVSYGSITIIDTNDIERIYTVYAKSNSNIEIPLIEAQNWSESITLAPGEGEYIWQRTVVQKTSIAEKSYSEPVCLTGSSGQSVDSILTYYCNYSNGRPEEDYEGWQGEIPQYDEDKPYYWIKTVIIFTDSTKKIIVESGEIISVNLTQESCCKSLKVDIEPIQDLNGYDKPWSGGNGKNKLYLADTETTQQGVTLKINNGVITVNGTASENAYFNLGTVSTPSGTCVFGDSVNDRRMYLYAQGETTVYSGDSFTGGVDKILYLFVPSGTTVNNKNYYPQIELGSTASAFEPYSNICPISGRTEVVTSRCGKNLLDPQALTTNWVSWNGTITSVSSAKTIKLVASEGETFTLSNANASSASNTLLIAFLDETNTVISSRYIVTSGEKFITKTAPANTAYIIAGFFTWSESAEQQLELGTTATDYEPYNGTSYTTALGQTVYGGTLDVVSGLLTVDRAYMALTPNMSWQYSSGTDRFFLVVSDAVAKGANVLFGGVCNMFKSSTGTNDGAITYINDTAHGFALRMSTFNGDMTRWKQFLTDNSVEVVYELATPQTIQFTPQEVELLKGQNNVWNDCGEIEVNIITISNRDVVIRQDNGITEAIAQSVEANANAATALSISQHANEDSQGAMAQAASNVSEIKRIWYAQSAATPIPAAPTIGITTTAAHDAWSITKPAPNNDYQYYFYCDQTKTGGGVYSWSEVILDTSNLSQYQIGALTSKVKNFWWDSSGAHVASGKNGNEVTTNTISTYGYHALMGLTGINFNYDGAKVVDLNSTTPSLDFYQPPTISGSTVTQGKKTMMLSANALKFYNPTNGTTEQAVLDSNGLLLKEGGIKSGSVNAGNSGFIYLSTKNYGSNLTINGHQASNWREVIGTKFGVDADGNLYASNANISGKITVGSGSNVYTTDDVNPLEIGGRNLSLLTGIKQALTLSSGNYWFIPAIYTTSDYGKSLLANTNNTRFTVSYDYSITGITGNATLRTLLRSTSDGTYSIGTIISGQNPTISSSLSSGHVSITFEPNAGMRTYGINWMIMVTNTTAEKEAVANATVTISNFKFEIGTKATDWTPAPEDVQAEIDAKKSVHTLTSSNTGGTTYATILGWSKDGSSINWNVVSTEGVRVGDTVRIGYLVSNMGTADNRPTVYVVGTVTSVNSATNLVMTSHGLDTTIIDGGNIITNSIGANQIAANAITSDELAANAVTAGKIAANAIDTSKLTVGTQNDVLNSNVLVGGRNLFGYGSQCESLGGFSCVGAWDITTEDGFTCAHVAGALTTTKYLHSKISFTPKPLEIMTFSLNVKIKNIVYGTTNPMCELYFDGQTIDGTWRAWSVLAVYVDGVKYEGSITNIRFPTYISDTKWHHFAVVAKAVNANFTANLSPFVYLRDATGDLYVRNIKYERGNKATDWSSAPEDTPKQLGVNMLRGTASMGVGSRIYNYGHWRASGGTVTNFKFTVAPPVTGLTHLIRVTNTGSAAAQIGLAQDGIPGAIINVNYTMSCWVRLSTPGRVYIRAFYYDGNTLSTGSNYFYIGTSWQHISWTGALAGTQYNQYSGGYIYFTNAPVNAYMDVCGMKIEEGIIPTDWCPALSDNGLLRKIPLTSFNKEANVTLSPNSAGTTLTITYTGSATTSHYGGYVDIPCEPSTTYDVGFYINPTGQWYFCSGSDGSSSIWTGLLGYQTLPTSAYRTCYRIITGASDTYFRLYFSTQAASTSLYIDDLTIVSCDMTMASQLATAYITDIDSKKGITIKPADSSGNDYLQMNSTDIRFIKGNTARMVLAATDLSFYDSGGQRRLLLNSSSGLLCGRTDKAYTQVTDGGLYIYNGASTQTNKKLAQVTAAGLEVFDSADGSSAAIFGATARVGKDGGARVVTEANGVGIYDGNNYRRATIDKDGIRLYGGNWTYPTVNVTSTSSGVYLDNNNYSIITSTGLNVVKGGTNVANFSTSARIGATTVGNKYVVITSSGLYVRKQVDASTTKDYLTLTDGWCCFGDPAASRITCNTTGDSPYFYMNAGGQNALYADATGVKVGNYSDTTAANINYSYIKSDGFHLYQANTEVAFFGATARIGIENKSRVYITADNGMRVYDKNNKRRLWLDWDGFFVYDDNEANMSAFTPSSVRVGKDASGHATIKSDGLHVWTGTESTATNEVAFFGATARVGTTSGKRFEIKSDGAYVYNGTTQLGYYGSFTRIGDYNGKNVRIDSDGIKFNSTTDTQVAVFSADTIELGKNSISSVISLCGGKGTIERHNTLGLLMSTTESDKSVTLRTPSYSRVSVNPNSIELYLNTYTFLEVNSADDRIYMGTHTQPGFASTSTDTGLYLGLKAYRWRQLYSWSAVNTGSDGKRKDVLGDIDFAKELIMGLEPVEFQWKDSDHIRSHMGFIAQDAAKVGKALGKNLSFYEASYIDESKGDYHGEEVSDEELSWGMMYDELIAPLVKVVQMQQKEIDQLKQEIQNLKNK